MDRLNCGHIVPQTAADLRDMGITEDIWSEVCRLQHPDEVAIEAVVQAHIRSLSFAAMPQASALPPKMRDGYEQQLKQDLCDYLTGEMQDQLDDEEDNA